MNSLTQDSSGLLGSTEAILKLEEKDCAEILVISDSHNNPFTFQKILEEKGTKSDLLVFCGDGINDLLQIIHRASASKEIAKILPPVIAFAQGNGDASIYPIKNPSYDDDKTKPAFSQLKVPQVQGFKVAGHRAIVTHGHLFSIYSGTEKLLHLAKTDNSELIFYGHTHVATSRLNPGKILTLNPGSISRPRGGQVPCFASLQVKKGSSDFLPIIWQVTGGASLPYNPR